MATLKEIAQLCNVSPSTVSNILNGKTNVSDQTRQKVMNTITKLEYQPNFFAQSMRKQNSHIIAIITEDLNEFSSAPIVGAIMEYCERYGYKTILMNLRLYHRWNDTWYENTERIKTILQPVIREILSFRADGLLYVSGHCRIIHNVFDGLTIPAVFAYGISSHSKYPSIIFDDEKGAYDITKYIISKGHSKLGLIGGSADNLHTKSRLIGYQRALFESNILYNPLWTRYGNWRRESGYHEAQYLIENGVTAIFCMNDNMAAGAYDYIYEKQLSVGKDISITGYDNKEIADYMRPELTTAEIPLHDIGTKSAETLLKMLASNPAKAEDLGILRLPCKMIERESVYKVPSS